MTGDKIKWNVVARVDKYRGDLTPDSVPYETIEREGNLLVTAGATAMWQGLTGALVTAFDNSNAYLGVGDSTTAAAIGQTDLQAVTNKSRKAMEATYPTISSADITFKSVWNTASGNYAWEEWGTFNASSGGTMLNRKVTSFGTKTVSDTWSLTVTISLA